MKTYHALFLLFSLIYTQGALERLGFPEVASKFIVEFSFILLIFSSLRQNESRIPPGLPWVAMFVCLTVISGILSDDGIFQSLLYSRHLVYAYLVLWTVWNAKLTAAEVSRLNNLIIGLWLLQVLASVFHTFLLGERIEAHVGTLTASNGSPATAFPLFALAYVIAYYCYYKRSFWLLILGLSFVLVGYSSGKRAIYFYLPAVYAGSFIWYILRERSIKAIRALGAPAMIFALCIPLLLFGLTESKRFEHLRGQSLRSAIMEALDVAGEYDTRVLSSGATFGRAATSKALLEKVFGYEAGSYLLGLGPTSMKIAGGRRGATAERIDYGVVGWAEDTISVGWPAMLVQLFFYGGLFWRVKKKRSAMLNSHYRALHFGCLLGFSVYFFLYFTYTDAFSMAGWLTFVQMYVVALILSPRHQAIFKATDISCIGSR